jgi:hypothetical protein
MAKRQPMRSPVNMNQLGPLRRRELAEPIGRLPQRAQDPQVAPPGRTSPGSGLRGNILRLGSRRDRPGLAAGKGAVGRATLPADAGDLQFRSGSLPAG